MTGLGGWLRDVADGVSSLRYGLTWNGEVRPKGRGVLPRRCGVCRAWTRGATRFQLFVDVNTSVTERTRVHRRVCAACRERHRRLEPEVARWREREDRRRLEDAGEVYRRWLRQAPPHPPAAPKDEPDPRSWYPEPFGMEPRPGQEPATVQLEDLLVERVRWGGDHERWILDLDTAAGGSRDHYAGSVFRLDGSRLLVVWRLTRSYVDD